MAAKCRLCGGKLKQNRCELCGLDNSVYDREERELCRRQKDIESKAAAGRTKASAGPRAVVTKKSGTTSGSAVHTGTGALRKRSLQGKKRITGITVTVILFVMLAGLIPALLQGAGTVLEGIFDGQGESYSLSENYSYVSEDDPYAYVTREIPDTGSSYEALIGSGVYQIGVHIPEGTYRIELWGGSGGVMLDDYDNIIFEYDSFGEEEEYGEVMEKEDVRLYNGARLTVDGGVVIRILTSNAQPLVQEITENPNQETIILEEGSYVSGEAFSEGMYNICPENEEDLFLYVTVSYPNENTDYFYPEINTYEAGGERYEENGVKNVIFPSGTQIEVEGGTVMLEPSAEYYKINYDNYPAGY